MRTLISPVLAGLLLWVCAAPMLPWAAAADQVFEWRHHGGTLKAQRYAPLDQIGRENVADLEVAWRWSARNFGPVPERKYITTPIMAGGRGPPV